MLAIRARGYEARELLQELLSECPKCYREFLENVEMIAENGALTESQAVAVFVSLHDDHQKH